MIYYAAHMFASLPQGKVWKSLFTLSIECVEVIIRTHSVLYLCVFHRNTLTTLFIISEALDEHIRRC